MVYSTPSQGLSGAAFNLEELMKLRLIFEKDSALTEKQFVHHFHNILGENLTPQQISYLFMKIDANSDGTVDWDEFTNFMFLHAQNSRDAALAMASITFVPSDGYVSSIYLPTKVFACKLGHSISVEWLRSTSIDSPCKRYFY